MRYLALTVALAVPAHADTPSTYAVAYAFAVGPSAFCQVQVDMTKAGAYALKHGLDPNQIGQMVWAEQQKAAAMTGVTKDVYCDQVAGAVSLLGLKP